MVRTGTTVWLWVSDREPWKLNLTKTIKESFDPLIQCKSATWWDFEHARWRDLHIEAIQVCTATHRRIHHCIFRCCEHVNLGCNLRCWCVRQQWCQTVPQTFMRRLWLRCFQHISCQNRQCRSVVKYDGKLSAVLLDGFFLHAVDVSIWPSSLDGKTLCLHIHYGVCAH